MTAIIQIVCVLFIITVGKCYPTNKPLFDIDMVLPSHRGISSLFKDTPPPRMPFIFPPLPQGPWSEDFDNEVEQDFPRLSIPLKTFQRANDLEEKSDTRPQEDFTMAKLQRSASPIASYDYKLVNTHNVNDVDDETSDKNGYFFIKDANLKNDTNFIVTSESKGLFEVTEQKPIEKLEEAKISVVLKNDDKSKTIDPDAIIFPEDVDEERNFDDIESKVEGVKSENQTVEATLYTNRNSMKGNQSELKNTDEIVKITVPASVNDRLNKSVGQDKAICPVHTTLMANNSVFVYINQKVFYVQPFNSLQVQTLPPVNTLPIMSAVIQSNIVYSLLNISNQLTFNDVGNQADNNRLPNNNVP